MKSESALTGPLIRALDAAMSGAEIFKHSERYTFGIPDISVNWINTAWLEIKATETERLEHHKYWEKQLITCRRLERATQRCWFVVYREMCGVRSTMIITPHEVFDDRHLGLPAWDSVGFDHKGVAEFVKEQLSK